MKNKKVMEKQKNIRRSIENLFKEIIIKKKSLFIKDDSDSSDTYESDEDSDIKIFMAVENQNNEFIEE